MSEPERFAHRLALALGMTVRQLGRCMSAAEMDRWHVYYSYEPWGEERADLRSAIVATAVVSSQGGKARPSDFMPRFKPTPSDPVAEARRQMDVMRRATIKRKD